MPRRITTSYHFKKLLDIYFNYMTITCEKVSNWIQLKRLATLAEEYSHENKQYDAALSVYIVELVRLWQLPNYEFYLFTSQEALVGYTIVYTDAAMLNLSLYVYDLFVTKTARGRSAFRDIINHIDDIAMRIKAPRVEFESKLSAKTWARLTGKNVSEKKIMVLSRMEA